MRIENLLLRNVAMDNKDYVLKQGMIFKGKIIEILNDLITIDIKGKGVIHASLESNISFKLGDELSFLVKDVDNNQINIKVVNQEDNINTEKNISSKDNEFITKLLKDMGIKETRLSTAVIENLVKSNVQITEPKVTEIVKVLEKILQLSNVSDQEEVVMIKSSYGNSIVESTNKEIDINNENLNFNKLINNNSNKNRDVTTKSENLTTNFFEDDFIEKSIIKEDIKNFIVVKKEENIELKNLKEIINKFLPGDNELEENSDYFKIANFLSKNKIKPSLNNIKNLEDFNKDPVAFVNKLELVLKNFNINNEKINLDENKYGINNNIFENIDEKIEKLEKRFINSLENKELKNLEEIKDSINKLEFLKDINKDMTFVFFPMNKGETPMDGILTLLKENKKRKNSNEPINIYMSLNTNNLGNIKISCQLLSDILNVKINLEEEDLQLFKNNEKLLIEKINTLGYSLNKIDFVVNNSISILDSTFIKEGSNYILDLKV